MTEDKKVVYGQFFTITNPFNIPIFYEWFDLFQDKVILEPFAGSANIPKMINKLIHNNKKSKTKIEWKCYDIDPQDEIVEKRDTIKEFPSNYNVVITNPPYLYKSSATRKGIITDSWEYDDLYKVCLNLILNNVEYCAVIIPESFITSDLFHDRLFAVIPLTYRMFEDTECPVCLSLFIPKYKKKYKNLELDDFYICIDSKLYKYKDMVIKKNIIFSNLISDNIWKFNDKDGCIGIKCIDNSKCNSIEFIDGNVIDKEKIKASSRSLTRVSGLPDDIDLNKFLDNCNKILTQYRVETHDIFLTSFKGLRSDQKYRRRLDFDTGKKIMDLALLNIKTA